MPRHQADELVAPGGSVAVTDAVCPGLSGWLSAGGFAVESTPFSVTGDFMIPNQCGICPRLAHEERDLARLGGDHRGADEHLAEGDGDRAGGRRRRP